MKKTLTKTVIACIALILTASIFSYSQSMKVASGSFGILNPKLRLQYEMGIGEKNSVGVAMHYYMVNWTGPKFEFFGRLYGKKSGNTEGFFLQGKVGYGNLKNAIYDDYSGLASGEQVYYQEPKKRWSTFGAGVATGYKYAVTDHFIIESLLGLHIYSSPGSTKLEHSREYNYLSPEEQSYYDAIALGEDIGWYLTTGLPLDFQIKFGYNF